MSTLTNLYWPFFGNGMESFGVNGEPAVEQLRHPNDDEVLARVDACAICASDAKMVRMGNDYPLFKDRDFSSRPARLGHELCLTVVEAGRNRQDEWPVGRRFGIQPDVYLNGERFCIGVNVPGGMAEYLMLGGEVFSSDNGSCAFGVPNDLSAAAVAQTEPNACIEASFVPQSRDSFLPNDSTLIYACDGAAGCWDLTSLRDVKDIDIVGDSKDIKLDVGGRVPKAKAHITSSGYDGIIVIGTPSQPEMRDLSDALSRHGLLAWLPQEEPPRDFELDIAKVHYESPTFCGSMDHNLSTALSRINSRYDYLPGGTLLISGGAGAMGRFHVMRALQSKNPPSRVVVTDMQQGRIDSLEASFGRIAQERDIELDCVLVSSGEGFDKVGQFVEPGEADDVIVCAPGVGAVECVTEFMADAGRLLLFAGTKYGSYAKIPLGLVPLQGASIVGHSGSSVMDQLRVIEKICSGSLDPNMNVAAIAGLRAVKEALRAVSEGLYSGKVIVYPQLKDLPLLSVGELGKVSEALSELVSAKGWSLEAEELLARTFSSNEMEREEEADAQ